MAPAGGIRVLHMPWVVAGNPYHLSRAERALGLASDLAVFTRGPFGYDADYVIYPKGMPRLHREWRRFKLLTKALAEYDVIHYNFGSPLYDRWPVPWGFAPDLKLAKLCGRKVFVTYQGCDGRDPAEAGKNEISACTGEGCYDAECSRGRADRRKRVAAFAKYADGVFAVNPDILNCIPRGRFLPYTACDLDEWEFAPLSVRKPLKFIHAPTSRKSKGSDYVLAALERLKNERPGEVDIVLVEDVPHRKVKELFLSGHVLVDQLLVGWYGGVAVECMALGRPVVAYIRERDLKWLPPGMREDLPVVSATPETIYSVLKGLLDGKRKLPALGRRSRAYVEKWHDPLKVARATKAAYEESLARTRPEGMFDD